MPTVVIQHLVDAAGLARLREPRDDLIAESSDAVDDYHLSEGPFSEYHRHLDVTAGREDDGARDEAVTQYSVVETTEYTLATPGWRWVIGPPVRWAVKQRPEGFPWWSPPSRMDARAARVLALLCTISMVAGYLGTLISQTITFAADEFGAGNGAQGATLAAVRIGALLSLWMAAMADRRGRRRLLLIAAVAGCLTAAVGALSPNLVVLGLTQTVSRGFATALALLIGVMAVEEMPKGARAYAAGLITMTSALGAGISLWILPIADLDERAWRILYLVPLAALPLIRVVARGLPESVRFVRRHASVALEGHWGRLILLCSTAFLGALFLAPASQFQNTFLRDEHGFTAAQLTIFTILTTTPAGLAIVVGGKAAETHGRRMIGAIGAAGGGMLGALGFWLSGVPMWFAWLFGTMVAALTVPALTVYPSELFPTSLRSKANGIITVVGLLGSGTGLILAGVLADTFDRFAPGMTILAAGPVLMAVLILVFYPETAQRELEEINPEDSEANVLAAPLLMDGFR